MPIGGFVVHVVPGEKDKVLDSLASFSGLTIYGHDEKGHIIIVLDTNTSEEMEKIVDHITQIDGVINCDLAYLHGEDEVKKIEAGEYKPKIRFSRVKKDS
ncbi:NapD family protein [Thermodesulfatator indicus DSM 15286]|uniref:Chaperone NapD n=1 Tax=Thermodesulfatator indicus (strain DSM 15286 / JCM 11887 / CIR29812) TaxID=667014 RepID=F8AE25_THEID|nr:chaperone NapD [Thermodesulfatator indicus]AEH46071.1 NapD family protein [Thermodesulfatator indicus DSM 15286]